MKFSIQVFFKMSYGCCCFHRELSTGARKRMKHPEHKCKAMEWGGLNGQIENLWKKSMKHLSTEI